MKRFVTTLLAALAASLFACNAKDTSADANDQALTGASERAASEGHILGVAIPRTITMRLGGTDQVLTNVGAGIRSKEPNPQYIEADDPLTDIVDGRIPYFVFQMFVPNVDAVVRTPLANYNTVEAFKNNPFLDSLAAQSTVVMRFSTVRNVNSDLFTLAMDRKFTGNGLNPTAGNPGLHPEDTQARADFLDTYRKLNWYFKGDYADFIVEKNSDGGANVTQVVHRLQNGVDRPYTLWPTEGPNRVPYVKGGPAFAKQIVGIMTAFNDDQADPGMAACRKSVLAGYLGN